MRHQDNHLKLSRKIRDPVAAIATAGSLVTSAQRTDYLNRANTFIQLFFRDKRDLAQDWLQGLVKTQSISWSTSGTALASDYVYWISVHHATNAKSAFTYRPPEKKPDLDAQLDTQDAAAFVIEGGKIYGYQGGVPLSSGSGNVRYIQSDVQTTSDATPAIDAFWDDTLVEIAATFFFEDRGEMENAAAQQKRVAAILNLINGKSELR